MSVPLMVFFVSRCVVCHCIVTVKFYSIAVTVPCASTGSTPVTEITLQHLLVLRKLSEPCSTELSLVPKSREIFVTLHVRLEVLMAVVPCSVIEIHQCFGGTCCLQL